jgi:hypothetical protein
VERCGLGRLVETPGVGEVVGLPRRVGIAVDVEEGGREVFDVPAAGVTSAPQAPASSETSAAAPRAATTRRVMSAIIGSASSATDRVSA